MVTRNDGGDGLQKGLPNLPFPLLPYYSTTLNSETLSLFLSARSAAATTTITIAAATFIAAALGVLSLQASSSIAGVLEQLLLYHVRAHPLPLHLKFHQHHYYFSISSIALVVVTTIVEKEERKINSN